VLALIFALPAFATEEPELYESTMLDECDLEEFEPEEPESEEPTPVDWEDAMNDALNWIVTTVDSPNFGVVGGEWAVLAVARSGFDVPDGWFEGYLARISARLEGLNETIDPNSVSVGWVLNPETEKREVRLSNAQSTENARLIVALTSLGVDASSIMVLDNVYDIVSRLGNRHNETTDEMWGERQGLNGPIWSLIALNSRGWDAPYEVSDRKWVGGTTAENPITLDERIDWILNRQLSAGGWALSGQIPNPDITGMAIQALTPHRTHPNVNEAIDEALDWLSESQNATGGWSNSSPESMSQVIAALSALGIDAQEDERFIVEGGYNPITALLDFRHESGGFWRGTSENAHLNADIMATEQAAYALVAYYRFVNGMNSLYDMSDAFEGGTITIPGPDEDDPCDNPCDCDEDDPDDGNNNNNNSGNNTGGNNSNPQPTVRRATISVIDPNANVSSGQTRVFFAERSFDLEPNETAYSLLHRTNLNIRSRGHAVWGGMYVEAINNFGEFDDGPLSGWMYRINGVLFPDRSSSLYVLQDGDRVEWIFTRNLGADIGGSNLGNSNNTTSGSGNMLNNTTSDNEEDAHDEDSDIEDSETQTTAITETEWENLFTDVSSDNWFYNYVQFAVVNGLMNGIGCEEFSPNTPLTRAMFITILARLGGVDTNSGNSWYSQAVEWGIENSITDGSNLEANVTREQMAAMLYRFAEYKGILEINGEYIIEFADWDEVNAWAKDSLAWAVANRLIAGRTLTTLVPQGNASRAEAAAILQRFAEVN